MSRILVIADDLTGAAEMAGIGLRFGLRVQITRGVANEPLADLDMLVVDTNSRQLSARAAAMRVKRCVARFSVSDFPTIFKKTDSALRGPIRAELLALVKATKRSSAIFLPQNPSRGRTILKGRYHIDGVPLHRTTFRSDPTHPATTNHAAKLLHPKPHPMIRSLGKGDSLPTRGIAIADAATTSDVRRIAALLHDDVLPAGGADFFTALLATRLRIRGRRDPSFKRGRTLFVCGTTTDQRKRLLTKIEKHRGIAHAIDDTRDDRTLIEAIRENRIGILCAPATHRPANAKQIERELARRALAIISKANAQSVFIEGGSTAAALCELAGWHAFEVVREIAPGIVAMRALDAKHVSPVIIMKPGSYPWPTKIWREEI